MKRICAALLVFFCLCSTAFAGNELTGERRSTLWSGLRMRKVLTEPQKGAIDCFDVSKTGMIAVGSSYSGREVIFIYDSEGAFQHAYTFELSGSYRFCWEGDALVIYLARERASVALAPSGEVLSIAEADVGEVYSNPIIEKRVGSTTYRLGSSLGPLDFLAQTHSQVIAIGSDGSERVIYRSDAPSDFYFLFVQVVVITLAIYIVVGRIFHNRKTAEQPQKHIHFY